MKKTFESVAWMRNRRINIDEEEQGLSWEEKGQKTRQLLENDPLWLKLKSRIIEPIARAPLAVGETKEAYGLKKPK